MPFVNYKQANLAKGQLLAGISASATSLILQPGQGDLFPDEYPYLLKVERYDSTSSLENKPVLKREIVKVTNKADDTFTMVRSAGTCPSSDTATTQTTTAFSFESGDYVYLIKSAEDDADLKEEVARLETDKLNISDYQNGTKVYAATSTGTDAYAVTLSPAPSAYVTGMCFRFLADVANTGAATLNVNALGAKTIKKLHDQDLATGDIEAGQIVTVTYDGTNFQMDSQVATIPTVDINGETEDTTGDIDADFVHEYDVSAGANRKVKPSKWKSSDAEALAGSATNKFITPAQLDKWFGYTVVTSSAPYTLQSADTARTKSVDTSWTKVKEIKIPVGGTYTIAFDLASGTANAGEGRIYKNGSAVGTTRTLAASSGAYTTYTEDLTFAANDLCQIYYRTTTTNAGCDVYVRNFRLKGVIVPNSFPAQATVNTD